MAATADQAEKQRAKIEAMRARGRADPTVIPHGTVSGYRNWACRCAACREAHRAYHADYRRFANVKGAGSDATRPPETRDL